MLDEHRTVVPAVSCWRTICFFWTRLDEVSGEAVVDPDLGGQDATNILPVTTDEVRDHARRRCGHRCRGRSGRRGRAGGSVGVAVGVGVGAGVEVGVGVGKGGMLGPGRMMASAGFMTGAVAVATRSTDPPMRLPMNGVRNGKRASPRPSPGARARQRSRMPRDSRRRCHWWHRSTRVRRPSHFPLRPGPGHSLPGVRRQ